MLGFLALALVVEQRTVAAWDREAFRHVYSGEWLADPAGPRPSEPLEAILPLARRAADARFLLLAGLCVAAYALWWGRRREAAVLGAALIALAPLSRVLEEVIARPSPFASVTGVGTFPSGHAAVSLGLVCCAWLLAGTPRRRLGVAVVGLPAALAVGVAVVSDGGHWPLDVVGGWLLALGWMAAVAGVFTLLPARRPPRPASPPLGAGEAAARGRSRSSRSAPRRAHG